MTAEDETPLSISTNATLFTFIGIGIVVIAIAVAAAFFCKYRGKKQSLGEIQHHQTMVRNNQTDEILAILKTRHAPIQQTTFTCQNYDDYNEE